MLIGLRSAIYPVADLAAARAWYVMGVVGHPPYFDEPFHVGFEVGGFELGLVPGGTPGTQGSQPHLGVLNARSGIRRLDPHSVENVGDSAWRTIVVEGKGGLS